MQKLEIKKLACVKCPDTQDYMLIKYCVSCCYFGGSFKKGEHEGYIPCTFNDNLSQFSPDI